MRSVPSSRAAKGLSCAILIPAYNEEATVAEIAQVALATRLGPVLVVSDGSSDQTAERAREAGAAVLELPENLGKGGAVYAGASHLTTEVILLIDADLVGLKSEHLHYLAKPVTDGLVDMTRGVFEGGRWRTTFAQQIAPQLNGQRAILRSLLLSVEGMKNSRYGIEIAITEQAKRDHWRSLDVPMPNVSQLMKEEKRGFLRGLKIRLGMYRDIFRTWLKRRT